MKRAAGCWFVLILCCQFSSAQMPGLVLPVGHTSSVSTASYSPDGRYIVTASWDNTAKIWLCPEGRLLFDLKGHSNSLTSAFYSHSGKHIITTSKDSSARLWRSNDGKLVHELKAHNDWVSTAAFSRDDRQVATASWDNSIALWDVASGRLVKKLEDHAGPVNTIAFSPDGKYLLSSSKDSTAILWQASDGKVLHRLRTHTGWVNSAVFNKDGSRMLTASSDGTAIIWETSSANAVVKLEGHTAAINQACFNRYSNRVVSASSDGTAMIWEIKTGKTIHVLDKHEGPVLTVQYNDYDEIITGSSDNTARLWDSLGKEKLVLKGHTGSINHCAFDPTGNFLLTASTDNSARIWSNGDGDLVSALVGHTSVVTSAAYSRNGDFLVTASWDNTAKLWSAVDGKLLSNLRGHSGWVNTAYFSPDSRYVVTASSDNTARIWSVPDGNLVFVLRGHEDWVGSAIFSADSRYVITTSWDNTSKIYEAATGEKVGELNGHDDYIKWINFSNDGKLLVTASADNTARIWRMPGGQAVVVLKGHTDKVRTAEFTADDKFVVTASWDSTTRIWEAATGKEIRILKGHKAPVIAAMISPNGKMVTTTSMDNTAKTWDIANGKLLHTLKAHNNPIPSAHYSRDGSKIVLASWDNNASIWDANNGKLLHLLKGHSASLKSAAFSPDNKFVITTSEDNTLKKWRTEDGEFLYTFFAVDSADYLAIDKDGRYDGTENARQKLYYTCGNEIMDLEQFKNLSWEPGLVAKLSGVNNEPITAKKITETKICNYTPFIKATGFAGGKYQFEVTARSGGLGDIQLFVNGKLIKRFLPSDVALKNNKHVLLVDQRDISQYMLSASDNLITVKASTAEGSMMSRGMSQMISNSRKSVVNPDMYIITVGISKYKDERLKLKYASKDAVDFNSAITSSAEKLLNGDGRRHVFSYSVNTETGNARWPVKERIEKIIDTIVAKARPDDILVIFFAGHGVLQTGERKFYLLTADASSAEMNGVEKDVAISTDELRDWLRRIKANKQLLILDACNSGQVVNQFQEMIIRRDVPADQQRALENLKDRTGTFILCASASGQAAYETSLYGQGLLTYSLLAGLKFGSGLRDNKFIDVTKWFNAAGENVKLLAREIGGRQDPQIIGNASFEIGVVDDDVRTQIQLANRKQVFKSSRFIQDEDLLNDDLDLTMAIDKEIQEVSTGRNSPWIFISNNQMEDAFSIRGRYEIANNKVTAKVSLFKNQKERIHQFEVSGAADRKEELAKKIIEITKSFMNQLAKGRL